MLDRQPQSCELEAVHRRAGVRLSKDRPNPGARGNKQIGTKWERENTKHENKRREESEGQAKEDAAGLKLKPNRQKQSAGEEERERKAQEGGIRGKANAHKHEYVHQHVGRGERRRSRRMCTSMSMFAANMQPVKSTWEQKG